MNLANYISFWRIVSVCLFAQFLFAERVKVVEVSSGSTVVSLLCYQHLSSYEIQETRYTSIDEL